MAPAATEFWVQGISVPRWTARQAARAESLGYAGYTFNDSQCLGADPYVAMMSAASVTTKLMLATAVTNPLTRHASVTACAAATLQSESGGRVVLGIGRGDSALAHLGLAPSPLGLFRDYVQDLQRYLHGETVAFREPLGVDGIRDVSSLGLSNAPQGSQLQWLRKSVPRVPVVVTGTGPRVIEIAARYADGLNLAVGADPERVRWAVEHVRQARAATGADEGFTIGAHVQVIVEGNRERARELVAGEVASFARFAAMHGAATGLMCEADRAMLEELHSAYDMRSHFQSGSPQAAALTAEFIDRYAILGEASYCIDRLAELADIGVQRFIVSLAPPAVDEPVRDRYSERLAADVIPHL